MLHHVPAAHIRARANEEFKRRFPRVFWSSLAIALLLHILALWLVMPLRVPVRRPPVEPLALRPPAHVRPAPAPPSIALPSGLGAIREAADEVPRPLPPLPDGLPDPPSIDLAALAAEPTFTPYQIAPELLNRQQAIAALNRFYPESHQDASTPVRLQLWFFIDHYGVVRRTLVKESSGFEDVDRAALRAAELMKFTPAWHGDRRVPVWIALPIVFELDAIRPAGADTVPATEGVAPAAVDAVSQADAGAPVRAGRPVRSPSSPG